MWPSCVDRCEDLPHSYVCMPFVLAGAAEVFQRCMRNAQMSCEARHQALLAERKEHLQEPLGPSESPKAQCRSGS